MRQQRKDILFHLRSITTQPAILLALFKVHLFSTQASLIALAQNLMTFRQLTCKQYAGLTKQGELYNRPPVFLVSMTNGCLTGENYWNAVRTHF
jgi:hypothetical protein